MTKPLKMLVPIMPLFLPAATRWVKTHEEAILKNGETLKAGQLNDAQQAGVADPEKIRVAFVDSIPLPGNSLQGLAKWTGLLSPRTAGLTLGHGTYIRSDFRDDRYLLVHEFVHVGQYERLGSIEAFLNDYLRECLEVGYPLGPLEQEAIDRAHSLVPVGGKNG
jgi:hypothetical protein